MNRLIPLCLVATLGALVAGCEEIVIPGVVEPAAPPPPPERVLPAAVRAALLPGVPDSIVVEDGRGCYLVSNVITEPRQGYLVRDASGEPLCYDDAGNRIPRPTPQVMPVEPDGGTGATPDVAEGGAAPGPVLPPA